MKRRSRPHSFLGNLSRLGVASVNESIRLRAQQISLDVSNALSLATASHLCCAIKGAVARAYPDC